MALTRLASALPEKKQVLTLGSALLTQFGDRQECASLDGLQGHFACGKYQYDLTVRLPDGDVFRSAAHDVGFTDGVPGHSPRTLSFISIPMSPADALRTVDYNIERFSQFDLHRERMETNAKLLRSWIEQTNQGKSTSVAGPALCFRRPSHELCLRMTSNVITLSGRHIAVLYEFSIAT